MSDPFLRARAALAAWLELPGRSQGKLAAAIGVVQQTVSKLLRDYRPGEDLAKRIELETDIRWEWWFTADELEEFERRERVDAALRQRRSEHAA